MRKFRLEYKKRCYMCKNPLDICIIFPMNDERFIRDTQSFETHRTIDFMNNLSMFKTKDCRAYRYCLACYHRPLKLSEIQMMEIGKKPIRYPISLTLKEVYDWCDRLYKYINRHDVDDCVVTSVNTIWPRGLTGIMSHA
jgi:hypothetical protein